MQEVEKRRMIDDQYPMKDTFSQQKKKDDDLSLGSHLETQSKAEEENKQRDKSVHVDNQSADNHRKTKPKVIILDDNPLSLSCYAEEYPENWKAITETKQKEKLE